jgi:hypothetical protein
MLITQFYESCGFQSKEHENALHSLGSFLAACQSCCSCRPRTITFLIRCASAASLDNDRTRPCQVVIDANQRINGPAQVPSDRSGTRPNVVQSHRKMCHCWDAKQSPGQFTQTGCFRDCEQRNRRHRAGGCQFGVRTVMPERTTPFMVGIDSTYIPNLDRSCSPFGRQLFSIELRVRVWFGLVSDLIPVLLNDLLELVGH